MLDAENFTEVLEQMCDTLQSINDNVGVVIESLFQLTTMYEKLRVDVDKLIENNQKGIVK